MALFTGKGDNGTTYTKDSKKRFSKDSKLTEALGTLDELNSFLGLVKVHLNKNVEAHNDTKFKNFEVIKIVREIQENLFIIQAELAGNLKGIEEYKTKSLSGIINKIETEIPPIKTFLISGGSETASEFDFARTIARRAERRVVAFVNEKSDIVSEGTLAYLNRLSSMLYALARLYNHKFGINEEGPKYQ